MRRMKHLLSLGRVRDASYVKKWLVLGSIIGVVAGIGAVVFIEAVELASRLLLHGVAGYQPPAPIGEGDLRTVGHATRPWAIPLVVALGGLISGFLVFRWAPEAEGHGTDAAIDAVHRKPKGIRPRVSLIKILASAITIGSGGSAGREGPTAQISAGFGSLLARRLDLSPTDARIAVTVGIGAGIGAIFRAPLGGAVLGAEILYREDIEADALLPSMVGSIIGFSIFGAFEGFTPIFGYLRGNHFDSPLTLLYYAVLGVAAGLVALAYSKSFYAATNLFHRMPGPRMLKPALAGLAVGAVGLLFPQALGTGYGFVQNAMRGGLPNVALWIILLLPFVKILATSLSIGSGGSGGIFGPGMVIGAFVGLGVWRLLETAAPGVPATPAAFMVVGMISCFGGISHAYLALMLMVAEMTGSLALLPPAMIALGVTAVIVGDETMYRSQLKNRAESPAHRFRFQMPLLATVPVTRVMSEPRLLLSEGDSVGDARRALEKTRVPGAPVTDSTGRYLGIVSLAELHEHPAVEELGKLIQEDPYPVLAEDHLDSALDVFITTSANWAPVIDGGGVVGIVSMPSLIAGYRQALRDGLTKLVDVRANVTLVEDTVADRSRLVGSRIGSAELPPGTAVLSIVRGGQLIFPDADTALEEGDVVTLATSAPQEVAVREALNGTSPSNVITLQK